MWLQKLRWWLARQGLTPQTFASVRPVGKYAASGMRFQVWAEKRELRIEGSATVLAMLAATFFAAASDPAHNHAVIRFGRDQEAKDFQMFVGREGAALAEGDQPFALTD